MTTSKAGVDLIISFEGIKLDSYKDIVGVWTIGVGHTGSDVHDGLHISLADAIETLHHDLLKFEGFVNSLVKVPLNQNQFDSLCCFTYNLGAGTLQKSTLLKLLNAGNYSGASDQILLFDHAGGHQVSGLTRRRTAEHDLFNSIKRD